MINNVSLNSCYVFFKYFVQNNVKVMCFVISGLTILLLNIQINASNSHPFYMIRVSRTLHRLELNVTIRLIARKMKSNPLRDVHWCINQVSLKFEELIFKATSSQILFVRTSLSCFTWLSNFSSEYTNQASG